MSADATALDQDATPASNLEDRIPSPLIWIFIGVAGALGYLVGDRIMKAFNDTAAGKEYAALTEVRIHYALVAGQVAFWFIFALMLVVWIRDLRRRYRPDVNVWLVFVSTLAMAAVIVVPFVLARGNSVPPVNGYAWRTLLLYVVGIVVFVPALVLLATIDEAARDEEPSVKTPGYVEEYFVLQAALRRVTVVLGVVISLVVFATGGYLNAVNAYAAAHVKEHIHVPPEASLLIYGALFVAVLVALFLPVFHSLRRRAQRIINENAELDAPQSDALLDKLNRRNDLEKALGLDETARQLLERGLIVLSPLLSAALATFVSRS